MPFKGPVFCFSCFLLPYRFTMDCYYYVAILFNRLSSHGNGRFKLRTWRQHHGLQLASAVWSLLIVPPSQNNSKRHLKNHLNQLFFHWVNSVVGFGKSYVSNYFLGINFWKIHEKESRKSSVPPFGLQHLKMWGFFFDISTSGSTSDGSSGRDPWSKWGRLIDFTVRILHQKSG